MSTNRTKIDWAYKQAQKIVDMVTDLERDRVVTTRDIAATLRGIERRGHKRGWKDRATLKDDMGY